MTACNAVPQAPTLQNPKPLANAQNVPSVLASLPPLAALMDPSMVQQYYHSQLFPAPRLHTPGPLAPSNLYVGAYFQGLSAAARIQRHAVTGTSQAARDSALQEFRQWLRAQVCIWDIYTCTPEDCCSYLTGYWLPKRGYQEDASGKLIAGPAPVTVESMLSHLRRWLDHLGREHEWVPVVAWSR
jgi:hypothetical protein